MEEDQVIEDRAQTAATPGLGLAKGIIAIVLGVLWLFIVPLIVLLGWALLLCSAGRAVARGRDLTYSLQQAGYSGLSWESLSVFCASGEAPWLSAVAGSTGSLA